MIRHIRATRLIVASTALAGLLTLPALAADQPTVEVLHWWTSGGEAAAARALKQDFEAHGGKWVDAPVAGGGGDAAMTVLRSRVLAGDPPGAV